MALGLYCFTQCTAALLLLTLLLNVAISICTGNENVFFVQRKSVSSWPLQEFPSKALFKPLDVSGFSLQD